ncbi:MAG: hypothetical protein KGQ51_14300 [Planctomycetes bacterium]|nr:hypothetical protein [Planctomycetota bacterium]
MQANQLARETEGFGANKFDRIMTRPLNQEAQHRARQFLLVSFEGGKNARWQQQKNVGKSALKTNCERENEPVVPLVTFVTTDE